MTTTISHPSDPVTNGASEIQSTNFAVVSADYTPIDWSGAQSFVASKRGQVFDYFPQGKEVNPAWHFYVRKDMTGASGGQRNLVGIRVVTKSVSIAQFSGAQGTLITVPVTVHRIEAYNWHLALLTLTDGTIIPRWVVSHASNNLVVDPESDALLYGDGTHRALYEALGFLTTPVAANKPGFTPSINALTGISPV